MPDSFLRELESIVADFFLHGREVSKIHWKAWPKLCKSKKEGGLCFRRLKEYNLALLAKQAWRIALSSGNVLHDVISPKYFAGSTFMEARLDACPSYTWRSVWSSYDILAASIRWKMVTDDLFLSWDSPGSRGQLLSNCSNILLLYR
ncbi:UNVERIFIED_CONTAM: hypothetical protein Slati_2177900 [Sesamum latifolium]|uniref:Uncharacterized protein n=1 Tax=Sesamum latifolium TaxID=2727402 RepID=A0AAW2WRR0_9LAMI